MYKTHLSMSNRLAAETSPYLLQHADNPVDWYPWGIEALQKAQQENKLIILSIGYSACHWCHVMEHETFEDQQAAAIMNEHFVCIKVDREERPDIDHVYILAVQLMSGQAGWPLNCICLPDQRPIYGGTYFRKADWMSLLLEVATFWKEKPEEAKSYADRLTQGLQQDRGFSPDAKKAIYTEEALGQMLQGWSRLFDVDNGGYKGAPKFPLPNNWLFLLRCSFLGRDPELEKMVRITLSKIMEGGIYDHIGGGFSRYSVDAKWHVPHFEKMLYDNAQLISLYSEAYQCYKDERYRSVVVQSVDWLQRELMSSKGAFFSAIDADSEGVEGKFYTYSLEELREILLPEELVVFVGVYRVTASGNWEEEFTNVFAVKPATLNAEERSLLNQAKIKVFKHRQKRIRPGTDTKILTSWNALAIKSLCDAYVAFGDPLFFQLAINAALFVVEELLADDGSLVRLWKDPLSENISVAFLDDYALLADAFIALYEVSFDEEWIYKANALVTYALQHFYDPGSGLFYYTSDLSPDLIARKHEVSDNVISSSNSVMALALFKLGHYFQHEEYLEQAELMLDTVFNEAIKYGKEYANWANLLLLKIYGVAEICITGPEWKQKLSELHQFYIPNKIILGGSSGSLPLLSDKFDQKITRIFVCKNKTCTLPVTEVKEALKQLTNK